VGDDRGGQSIDIRVDLLELKMNRDYIVDMWSTVLYACIQDLCSTDDDTATCNSPEDSRLKYYLPEIA
jgi:hypothetical protein